MLHFLLHTGWGWACIYVAGSFVTRIILIIIHDKEHWTRDWDDSPAPLVPMFFWFLMPFLVLPGVIGEAIKRRIESAKKLRAQPQELPKLRSPRPIPRPISFLDDNENEW
jgi:hypothetical protein